MVLMAAALFLVLAGAWQPAAAQDEDGEAKVPEGSIFDPAPPTSEAEVFPPPSYLDELEELNPVDADSVYNLTLRFGPAHPIFRKYLFRPVWSPPGHDHLAAGGGTRNTGYTTIRFRGLLPGATAISAFLYWAGIQAGPVAATQNVVFNGNPVTGFLISNQPQPCWNGLGTLRAYRAPVLPFLLPGVNGDYSVTGLPSNLANGQDPWNPVSTVLPLSEGASLVVLYTHPSIPAGTWVQIHHPVTANTFGTLNYTHFLNLPIQVAATRHTRLGADGQVGGSLNNINATTNEQTFLAGPIPQPFVQIRGNGSYFAGSEDSDWNGHDGEPLNQLWDTHTMNIPGVITPGPLVANYRVRYVANADCIVPVAHVITAR
jgi:hypothetical protein